MLVVVAVNATLVYFAMHSWGGLVTDHAFERGVAYNRLIAEAAAEEALGWKADVAYQPAGGGEGAAVIVSLRTTDGKPMDHAAVALEAARPVEAETPVSLGLRNVGNGRYIADAASLRAGQWDVRMTVANDGHEAHSTHRILVR